MPPSMAISAPVMWRAASDARKQIVSATSSAEQATPIGTIVFATRSEEHTSELQSLMRISYAVFCLKKKKTRNHNNQHKCPLHIALIQKTTANKTTHTKQIHNLLNITHK